MSHLHASKIPFVGLIILIITVLTIGAYQYKVQRSAYDKLGIQYAETSLALKNTQATLKQTEASLSAMLNQDQFKRNEELQAEINNIHKVYGTAVKTYEEMLELRLPVAQSQPLEKLLAEALAYLSDQNYSSASASLAKLQTEIDKKQVAAFAPIPANVPAIQEAPTNGYRQQQVTTEFGTYLVDVIASDLNSTRVVVATASTGDCRDNCPVSSLADYVSKAGGFAGINGPYFCPAEYPSCAGKTNSFDTLLMKKDKVYFNSDNNVYSSVPAIIFSGSSARLVGQSSEWGRDTGVDSVIASQPLLLSGGEVRFGGGGDPKQGSKGSRSFIGTKDSTVYIGVVRNATVAEVAQVLKVMGLQSALNLDSGGSTALMSGGRYLAGPGRNTPFGIVLVGK